MSTEGGTRAILAALIANVGIAVSKLCAWLLTGSSSMLAESIHSLADSGNQLLLLLGGKRANREADRQHPFGYGRERYIYAFIVSIVLFSVGGLFALYEGYHKISHPKGIHSWAWVPVTILIVAIGLETYSFMTALREANKSRGSSTLVTFIRRAKAPELPVVLLEDTAALLGLVFALFGVGMTLITDNGIWDGIGTAAIGILLVAVAVFLALETKSLLLGESATDETIRDIEHALLADGGPVERIIHMKTLHLGPEELLVAAKIAVRHDETAGAVAEAINAAEIRIRAAVPIARVIYLEPDIYHSSAAGKPGGPADTSAETGGIGHVTSAADGGGGSGGAAH
jgi:cation diffusion facilitator family transporter